MIENVFETSCAEDVTGTGSHNSDKPDLSNLTSDGRTCLIVNSNIIFYINLIWLIYTDTQICVDYILFKFGDNHMHVVST